jgi:two-component system sensor kinase FixL
MIIELTGRKEVASEISRTKPNHIQLMDHVAARLFWEIFQQLAERELAENQLRTSEQEKHAILNSMSEYVVFHDTEHRIVWANRVAGKVAGLTPEELAGRHCYEVWHQRSKPCPGCPVVKTLETGQLQEEEMTSPDGRVWLVRSYPALDSSDHIAGVVEVALEATERKRAEEAVRASEERNRTVLEASPDPIVVYDVEGVCVYINPAFTRVFGWSPEERLGKKLDYVPEENWPETQKVINLVQAGESFSGVESRRYTKEGGILDVSISAAVYLNADGIPVGSVHILRDISDRKRAKERLKETMVELERSNAELLQFAYVASHDLQEPLRKIQAFGDRLKTKYRDVLDERGRDYFDRMQNASKRMQSLVNNLLTLSRITTKAQPFVPVNLADVMLVKYLMKFVDSLWKTMASGLMKSISTVFSPFSSACTVAASTTERELDWLSARRLPNAMVEASRQRVRPGRGPSLL